MISKYLQDNKKPSLFAALANIFPTMHVCVRERETVQVEKQLVLNNQFSAQREHIAISVPLLDPSEAPSDLIHIRQLKLITFHYVGNSLEDSNST